MGIGGVDGLPGRTDNGSVKDIAGMGLLSGVSGNQKQFDCGLLLGAILDVLNRREFR